MLGDGRREKSTKLFFLEVKAYRSAQATKEPEPFLVTAYGVKELAPAATVSSFTFGFRCPLGGPRRQAERGMALAAIYEF